MEQAPASSDPMQTGRALDIGHDCGDDWECMRKVNEFKEWFSAEEVDQFRDNADTSALNPLFHRWQDKMEELLTLFAAQEGLESPGEIVSALEECRSDTGDWKTLNNLINSMTEKEVRRDSPLIDYLSRGRSSEGVPH